MDTASCWRAQILSRSSLAPDKVGQRVLSVDQSKLAAEIGGAQQDRGGAYLPLDCVCRRPNQGTNSAIAANRCLSVCSPSQLSAADHCVAGRGAGRIMMDWAGAVTEVICLILMDFISDSAACPSPAGGHA